MRAEGFFEVARQLLRFVRSYVGEHERELGFFEDRGAPDAAGFFKELADSILHGSADGIVASNVGALVAGARDRIRGADHGAVVGANEIEMHAGFVSMNER